MKQWGEIRQRKRWKLIVVWMLAIMLAVTMSVPAVSFAAENSDTKDKKASEEEKSKEDKDSKKEEKSKEDKESKESKEDKKSKEDKDSKKDKESKEDKDTAEDKEPKKPAYYLVKKKNGVLKCWGYDENGVKNQHSEQNAYFIVNFDKGSKVRGTAVKSARKSGKMYYFNEERKGEKYTGWFEQHGRKYYFKKGKRLKGIKKVDKIWYSFNPKNGRVWRKIGDTADKNAQSYSSPTKYLIIVNRKKHRTRVYEGKKKNWKKIHSWKCATGKKSTPTPKGTFYIGVKGLHFDTGKRSRCWYYTQFYGSYMFHSVLYDRQSKPVNCTRKKVGASLTHGCIRLRLDDAKWIHDHIPRGTKVVIK